MTSPDSRTPVLVGVGAGADALMAAGHKPALIVGDPSEVSNEALTCGADIVVPAFADGHAPGLHRVQDTNGIRLSIDAPGCRSTLCRSSSPTTWQPGQ